MKLLKHTVEWGLAGILLLSAAACSSAKDHEAQHHGAMTDNVDMDHEMPTAKKDDPNITADWTFAKAKPEAGKATGVSIQIKTKKGKHVKAFEVAHEKKMHLIVVSKDLAYFQHLHPKLKKDGLFEVTTVFPEGGEYKLVADFVPKGGMSTVRTEWVTVSGKTGKPQPIVPDEQLVQTVGNRKIVLSFGHLMAGMDSTLTYHLTDAATGEPIKDLQPYLGAIGHVVIMSADTEQYLHVHPANEKATGPDAEFMTAFPHSGVYKIWAQFQQNGEVFTVPFVVKAP